MLGKINMGYGGVEINDDHLNIVTKTCPMKSEDGFTVKEEKDKIIQLQNIKYMTEFIEDCLLQPAFVKPVEIRGYDRGAYMVSFMVAYKYVLSVVYDSKKGNLYPSLFLPKEGGGKMLKFSYEGETTDYFFKEIKKDIRSLIANAKGLK
jgi:hypothetical protein